MGRMSETAALGVELWNDSCALNELKDAVAVGMVGATSNPVIVGAAVQADKARLIPVLDALIAEHPRDSEDEIAWRLIAHVVKEGAAVLEPTWKKSDGARGFISAQVSPKHWRNPEKMLAHAKELVALAPNVAIKAPSTAAGIEAMEEMIAAGINVNATVSFSVAQAVAIAEAFERGRKRAQHPERLHPWVTIMIGRVDDHVKRVLEKSKASVDPGSPNWAGIAVFKNALRIFRERKYSSTLLAAAYRHHLHWSELIGPGVAQTIPYPWWKQFDGSDITPKLTLDTAVEPRIIEELRAKVPDFARAYDEDGMKPAEFATYGATVNTLKQFLDGYEKLVQLVRERMLP
jgi:transaldolase